jgi:hypothetical protein
MLPAEVICHALNDGDLYFYFKLVKWHRQFSLRFSWSSSVHPGKLLYGTSIRLRNVSFQILVNS